MPLKDNPEILNAAIRFLADFAGVAVAPEQIVADFAHGNQQVLAFSLPEDLDIEATRKQLCTTLGVPYDGYQDHHGEQYTWDIEPDRKRVTLTRKWNEAPQIGLVHWNH